LGCQCTRHPPTPDKKESDFLATFDTCKVFIEEKTKFDDSARLSKRAEVLSKGEIHASSTPIIRNNRLSGIISGAAEQLQSSSEQEHDFRLIWFTGTGTEAEAKFHQFIATIYGSTKILEMNALDYYRPCYFFRDSDFHRHAAVLDGAVVAYVSGTTITAKLCINPLSPNAGTLRNSPVADVFGTAIEDPAALEAEGIAFILDGDVNRKNEEECLAFLQAKYKTKPLMKFDLGHISAAVLVPNDDC
jgi:hypothetical protein